MIKINLHVLLTYNKQTVILSKEILKIREAIHQNMVDCSHLTHRLENKKN
jgi:hypothetical protein